MEFKRVKGKETGNGCSICVVKDSKSLNTSMGFTPLAGVMMGTRSGDVDPSVIFHLLNQNGMDPKELERMFTKESGLLGVSEASSDMREIISELENGNEKAALAREMFSKRVTDVISMYLSEVDNFDAITFTGGIGENDFMIIEKILEKLRVINIEMKSEVSNDSEVNLISKDNSAIPTYIVPTNEELYMAKIGKTLIGDNDE